MVKRFKNTVLFFCFLLIVIGCGEKFEDSDLPVKEDVEYPSQEGWNSELYLTKTGQKQAVLKYGHMQEFDKKNIVYFDEGVQVDFYDRNGNHTSRLTSERGEYHEKTEDVMGMGHVVVVSDSGVTLRTEVLRWDNRRAKIYSDTLVMLTTEGSDTLYGIGFESNADLTRRVIYKPWGVSDNSIDFDELESSFSKPVQVDSTDENRTIPDSVSVQNTVPVNEQSDKQSIVSDATGGKLR